MSAAAAAKRVPAGVAAYRGDVSHIVGEVKGPTTYGGLVVAVSAEYFSDYDRTRVTFAHATVDDIDALAADLVR